MTGKDVLAQGFRFGVFLTSAALVWMAGFTAWRAVAAPVAVRPANAAASATCVVDTNVGGRVTAVTAGDVLQLEDGRTIRLMGIEAVIADRAGQDVERAKLAQSAREALAKLVQGHVVSLGVGGRQTDRKGRLIAQVFLGKEWVQGAMVGAGLARVRTYSGNDACAIPLLQREQSARVKGNGLWRHPEFAVRQAETVLARQNGFTIVEGRVRSVSAIKSVVYLNFGEDYRSDFTVAITSKSFARFGQSDADAIALFKALEGRTIRVRGYVRDRNGPMIYADHPAQIEDLPLQPAPLARTSSESQ
ncbi:MAG TPA: nuclease [Alphaproteobacteria bacterium]|nr:nuclease [Alphaproteobacteria bacterium]HAJ48220.1 nuclease [Alphaproteobacteria bacterium]